MLPRQCRAPLTVSLTLCCCQVGCSSIWVDGRISPVLMQRSRCSGRKLHTPSVRTLLRARNSWNAFHVSLERQPSPGGPRSMYIADIIELQQAKLAVERLACAVIPCSESRSFCRNPQVFALLTFRESRVRSARFNQCRPHYSAPPRRRYDDSRLPAHSPLRR